MNWYLLLTFVAIVLITRFIVKGKPKFDWDKEEKYFYLWYTIHNKYGSSYRDYLRIKL